MRVCSGEIWICVFGSIKEIRMYDERFTLYMRGLFTEKWE